jgi:HAD superfamily hydrolase (TIGR01509 family)
MSAYKPTLFLDDGGVLNDNAVRGPQWQALVAEYFVPRLGGSPQAWAEANLAVITSILGPGAWNALMAASADYADFERRYFVDWLSGMCDLVGVAAPSPEACVALGLASEAHIIPRVRSAFPGAAEAVRALHAAGYALHTASGASSRMLGLYLDGMGVRACFGRLYGPDLAGAFKNGPAFYERMLADLGLPAREALFLDDHPLALAWAAQTGAHTLLVGPRADPGPWERIHSLAELPGWLERRAF